MCTIWTHINRFKVNGLCYKFCRTSPKKIASFTGLIIGRNIEYFTVNISFHFLTQLSTRGPGEYLCFVSEGSPISEKMSDFV